MKTASPNDTLAGISIPPKGPFLSDPQGAAAWSWAIMPVILFVLIVWTAVYLPEWYLRWAQPEGYGLLELSHFFVPAATAVIALSFLSQSWVRRQPLLIAWSIMLALGCIYIAGEEHSWGQHFFKWDTPEYWRNLNRQEETNLHNVSHLFGNLPRSILFAGIVAAGFVYPLLTLVWPVIHARNPLAICMPPLILLPTALCLIVIDILHEIDGMSLFGQSGIRLSEISETYIYLFLLLGVIIMRRRILEVSRTTGD